jgi:hypothetical protein
VAGLASMGWALLALAASHIYSFAINYVGAGEYRRADASQLLFQPYGRVVVLHVTILGGAFILALMKSPVGGLVLLVVLKTAMDAFAHLRERLTNSARASNRSDSARRPASRRSGAMPRREGGRLRPP